MASHYQWSSAFKLFYEAIMARENIWKYSSVGECSLISFLFILCYLVSMFTLLIKEALCSALC